MRKVAVGMLMILFASVALTAGVFGSENGAGHAMSGHGAMPCVGAECDSTPATHDVPPVDCIAHCLRASAPMTTETAPTIAALSIALIATFVACRRLAHALASPGATDAIAAFVRKRTIATVVLRN